MKKILNNKVAMFALAVLAIIVTVILVSNPITGAAMLAVFPMIVKIGDKDFTVKSQEELDQINQLKDAIESVIELKLAGMISKAEFEQKVLDKIKEHGFKIKDDEEFKTWTDRIVKMQMEIKAFNEVVKDSTGRTLGGHFKAFMLDDENKDTLEDFKAGRIKEMKFTVKTAGAITGSHVTTSDVPQGVRDPGLNDVAQERRFIIDLIGTTPTTSKTIEYVEKKNQDGTVIFVPDTDSFAQIDFDMTTASSTAKDVGAFITVHEDMLADIDFLAGEIDRELAYQIYKAADAGVLTGVGTGEFLKGISVFATGGFSVTSIDIEKPTIGDCISAALRHVELVGFDIANMIVMNPADYENMLGAKDVNGQYVRHPSLSPDGTRFAGIEIYRSSFITAGTIMVGNKMKSNIKILQGVEFAVGYNLTGEFAKRWITVRGGMRLHHYIKSNDVNSFLYDTLDNITAAIRKETT